jgi:tRNA A-37 threonylcarbamoyl transferase component Bud32
LVTGLASASTGDDQPKTTHYRQQPNHALHQNTLTNTGPRNPLDQQFGYHPAYWRAACVDGIGRRYLLELVALMCSEATIDFPPKYEVLKPIGRGATAVVYLVRHRALNRELALKIMASPLVLNAELLRRFREEGKRLARLDHPNIIRIYDSDAYKNSYYLAMEYLPGGSLRERIGHLRADYALDILWELLNALQYAHREGVVHRDIKPGNILFRSDGKPVLSDFGIAKVMEEEEELTIEGGIVGTPRYMSPEQARGNTVDVRTDFFSIGIVLYEMLTGRLAAEVQPRVENKRLPHSLSRYQRLLDRLTATDPNDRFQTADQAIDFVQRLRAIRPERSTSFVIAGAVAAITGLAAIGMILAPIDIRTPGSEEDGANEEHPTIAEVKIVGAGNRTGDIEKRFEGEGLIGGEGQDATEAVARRALREGISAAAAFDLAEGFLQRAKSLKGVARSDAESGALLLLVDAAEGGHGRAAFVLARAYDPTSAESSLVMRPRAEKAYRWYMRAAAAGIEEAEGYRQALERWIRDRASRGDAEATMLPDALR